MSSARVRVLSAAEYFETVSLSRSLAVFLLVCATLFIFFAATFPFDFDFTSRKAVEQLSQPSVWDPNPYDENYTDRTQNIIFFIPFGFVLAAVIPKRPLRIVIQLALAMIVGFLLTCTIETLQAFVSFRDPSLADIWCNTLGSVIGAGIYVLGAGNGIDQIGDVLFRFTARILLKLRRLANPIVITSLLALYTAGQLIAPTMIRGAGDMSTWDNNMPLNLGFAPKFEDRTWSGQVHSVVIADRAMDAAQVRELANGADPAAVCGESLLGNYKITGSAPYTDQTGQLPALAWVKDAAEVVESQPPSLNRDHALATTRPITPANYRIGKTSEFSLAVRLSTDGQDQRGPALFLAISGPDQPFNIRMGQEFGDLAMRLRTAVRGAPEMYLAGVFADNRPHHIVVTQRKAQTIIYVDGYENGRVEVTPEAKMIWRLYPRGYFRMWIDRYGYRSYAAIYRVLVFIPFAALLAAAMFSMKLRERSILIAGATATVVMSVALELMLGQLSASGFQVQNLIISIFVGSVSLGALIWAHHRNVMRKRIRFQ